MTMHLFNTFVDEVLREMGQLPKVAVLAPHTLNAEVNLATVSLTTTFTGVLTFANLGDHLGQLHSSDSWTEPSI